MSIRTFLSTKQKALLYASQNGRCGICDEELQHGQYHDDHKLALVDGGTNDIENRRLVCVECHRIKSAIEHSNNAKTKRLRFGRPQKSKPMPGSRTSGWIKRMNGTVEKR